MRCIDHARIPTPASAHGCPPFCHSAVASAKVFIAANPAANGGFVGQLKRQLEPLGSQALDDDEDDDDLMEA